MKILIGYTFVTIYLFVFAVLLLGSVTPLLAATLFAVAALLTEKVRRDHLADHLIANGIRVFAFAGVVMFIYMIGIVLFGGGANFCLEFLPEGHQCFTSSE